ncbi:MAG: transcriptional repressor [Clostridia bacterium]|nr:transcriptional repressor [Clostridia bacterium]
MKNFSRQREAVKKVLCSTKTHPTAAWIYENVRKELPNISLGTVYRNLNVLSEERSIKKLSFGDGNEHFDGDISPHSHFYCECCGKIYDIAFDATELCKEIADSAKVNITSAACNFSGKCSQCQ